MIANPTVPAFRFDPYSKKFTRETYEHAEMRTVRGDAVKTARRALLDRGAASWAVILGTLGRQGSVSVLQTVTAGLPPDAVPPLLILLSEMSPQKLALFSEEEISTFVQTSCPRLSIDWGYAFSRPLLSPYEASVAAGRITGWEGLDLAGTEKGAGDYPMDFYAVSVETPRLLAELTRLRMVALAHGHHDTVPRGSSSDKNTTCMYRQTPNRRAGLLVQGLDVRVVTVVCSSEWRNVVVQSVWSVGQGCYNSRMNKRRHDRHDCLGLIHKVWRKHLFVCETECQLTAEKV